MWLLATLLYSTALQYSIVWMSIITWTSFTVLDQLIKLDI